MLIEKKIISAALIVAGIAGCHTAAGPPAVPAEAVTPAPRNPGLWPFSIDSPWNTPIGSGARYAENGDPCTQDLHDTSITPWINAEEWSHPVYLATRADPLVGIYRDGVLQVSIHVPADASPAAPQSGESDAHLHVIDPTRHYVDEMWQARKRPTGGWDAQAYQRNDLYGPGVGSGGTRAYGGSAIGGLIRRGELKKGIPHVLAFGQPAQKQRQGFVWPASAEDDFSSDTYRGHVPLGQLVAIPPSVDLAAQGLSPQGLAIARALQDYGAYNVDSAGAFTIYAEPAVETELGSARDDMPVIRAQLRCVTNNRPDNVGGGGIRRASPAAPLALVDKGDDRPGDEQQH